MGKSTISLAIFNSYVKLPEGNTFMIGINQRINDLNTGWWFERTPLKNDGVRQLGWLLPIYGKIKNVPNHQAEVEVVTPNR